MASKVNLFIILFLLLLPSGAGAAWFTVAPPTYGHWTTADTFISCPPTCSYNYPLNTAVTATFVPATCWAYGSSTGDCTGSPCSLTMSGGKSITSTTPTQTCGAKQALY